MALLDDLLGGIMRNAMGGGTGSAKGALIQAVLAMLLQRGIGGGNQPQGGGGLGGLGSILDSLTRQGGSPGAGGGLGDLGSILGGLTGQGGNPRPGGELGDVLGGGLGGLGQLFEQAGMGDQVKSWMSTGQNMPISPDQVAQVFGDDQLGQLADASGMSREDAASQLSQILPDLVDGLTPRGSVPQGDEFSQDDLGQLVSRVLAGGR